MRRRIHAATSFAGAHVLLTGASRGLGEVLADELAGRGARLSLVARDAGRLDTVARRTGGVALPTDLTDTTAVSGLAARATAANGPVDVLVNNAAAFWLTPLEKLTTEQLVATVAVNLIAPAELIRTLIPDMRARGRGHIVNVASLGGIMAIPDLSAYGASKAGLAHLTEILRTELADTPIGLTLVQLAAIEGTDMYYDGMRSPMIERVARRMGRFGLTMSEPAEAVARQIADAVERGRSSRVVPRIATVFHLMRRSPIAVAAALDTHRKGPR
ncbi:MAG TPA: SDR family oxidoreductase [Pseudonocardia sp.]